MAKKAGHEVTLRWDANGGTALVTIGQIIDITGPSIERNPIDVSTRDSTGYWREFIKGFKDLGELTFNVVFDGDLQTHGTATGGLLSDFVNNGSIPAWQMLFPMGTISFRGFLTGAEIAEPLDDALTADITTKLTGAPTFAF